jgi:predicted DnaQ family exonuclease/DinG family helicase
MNPDSQDIFAEPSPDTLNNKAQIPSIHNFIDFVAIDTETTGLFPDKDDIIEIAAVRYKGGIEIDRYNSFVKPNKTVPHYIEYLTHITPAQLKSAPPISMVLKELKAFVGNSVIVGHNTKFDLDFINTKFIQENELPFLNQWWDTCELSRIYLPFAMNHKLTTMCEVFKLSDFQAHRAINDAKATAELFTKLIDYAIAHHSVTINARIYELSNQAQTESNLNTLLEIIVNYQRKYSLISHKPIPINQATHNVIEHKCLNPVVFKQHDIFKENGILHGNFEQYEFRSGQLDMADLTEAAFNNETYLVVEAGTGVGKSFAYLIPALQFSYSKSKKVVVSTNTKNLQEQLFNKDIPILTRILQIPFKAVLVKGRENYICERRWDELLAEQSRGLTSYEAAAMLQLVIWKLNTTTGDITENSSFNRNQFSVVWRRLCSDRYSCANRKCQHFTRCYLMKLRKNIEDASLVVVNHSLLLADLQSDHVSLGEYDHLIIDEAHNIMQTAARSLGLELTYAELINQVNQLSKVYRKRNVGFVDQIDKILQNSVLPDANKEHIRFICTGIEEVIETNRQPLTELFVYVGDLCSGKDIFGKLRIKDVDMHPELFDRLQVIIDFWKVLIKQIHALNNVFTSLSSQQIPSYDILMDRLNGMEQRAAETETNLLKLMNPDLDNYAYWLEAGQKTDKNIPSAELCYAPIEVDTHLNNLVYKNVPCIIFTSATMALRDSFKFFMNQSGLTLVTDKQIKEKVVESPFDYARQSRLMVAGFLPEPNDKYFLPQALDLIEMVCERAPVGTLTLFTSYKDLDAAYNKLNEKLYQNDRPLFAQGKWSSRTALLDEFRKHNNAVLLGTSSFWEGIDVQGESLSLLILFKLPFQVPTEPTVEAYIEKLEKEQKDSFMHYILPNALLRLRQGFGRLIRSKTDTGIVIIIDPRVTTKRYGHYFQEVLPATSIIMKDPLQMQSTVIEFFKQSHSLYKKGN